MRSPETSSICALLWIALMCASGLAQDGRSLFLEQCARCHGQTGDGQGTEQLDRPARSFREGGFAFGDTELAIYRTITHGIPGSPMPAFGEGLTDAQRHAVSRFVRTLCPPRIEVPEEDTDLIVGRHALVAKGLLPPVVDGARSHPRGLLLGTPDGLTFQYRTDDLRLLAVRQGDFARRADWTGRGGAPLQPLGRVVWLNEDGDPSGLFYQDQAPTNMGTATEGSRPIEPLRLQLASSSTGPKNPSLTSLLVDPSDRVIGSVTDTHARLTTTSGSGFRRTLTIRLEAGASPVAVRMPWTRPEMSWGASLQRPVQEALQGTGFTGDGIFCSNLQCRVLVWSPGVRPTGGFGQLLLDPDLLPEGSPQQFSVSLSVVLTAEELTWSACERLVQELLR